MARRIPIRGARELARLSERQREAWERAGSALALARREGMSLRAAARKEKTTVGTVRRYYPSAVWHRGERGWWHATERDRAYRGEVHVITADGDLLLELRSSHTRSLASEHALAVKDYLDGRDREGRGLRLFRGRRIARHRLLDDRDLDLIDELERRGELDWPDLYEWR